MLVMGTLTLFCAALAFIAFALIIFNIVSLNLEQVHKTLHLAPLRHNLVHYYRININVVGFSEEM